MNKDVLQQQADRGQEAQLFLKYIEDNPYFLSVMKELEEEYANKLLKLKPSETELFTIIQATREALYEPLKKIQGDKLFGEHSQNELEGKNPKEGIL